MIKDPHFEREQDKYENPIPSREYIIEYLRSQKSPITRDSIAAALQIHDEEQLEALRRRLRAMERDGELVFTRGQSYGLPEKMDLISGTVLGHKEGYGFFKPDEGGDDLFISNRDMLMYFHGDKVLAQKVGMDRKGRREARIVRLIQPRSAAIVGRFHVDSGMAFVIADDKRITQEILIASEDRNGARQGDVVVVELTRRPGRFVKAAGKVTEVLGKQMAPGMEIEIALRNYDLPHTWSAAIEKKLRRIPDEVTESDKVGRVDLRSLPLVTIDGEDARDFDDAVYAEVKPSGGWRLWVAIADVSYYVRTDSALDTEARARGNSVYFPSQVIPMLPEKISNGLCSLNPHVDRLCMVAEMTISARGKLSGYKFYPAVMHSHARFTYTQVAAMLEGGPIAPEHEALFVHLQCLQSLYLALDEQRAERGAIAFETIETQFIFNDQRKIDKIVPRARNQAHKIIEECMILANVSAAKFVKKHKGEILYRVHESPSEQKLANFKEFLAERGLSMGGGLEPTPADYQNVMLQIADRPDAELIQVMLLRSMRQAIYTPDNEGHFGLALEEYAHFTSPIRRYPDLVLHRVIRYLLAKEKGEANEKWTPDGGYHYQLDELDQLGEECSTTERRADEATRDVSDWLKCEFMQDHVGDTFEAVIASVTNFGLFVRLNDLFIDGLVHISSLGSDYYQFDPMRQRLIGEHTGQVYQVGDPVTVKVAAVNLDDRQIDLMMLGDSGKGGRRKAAPSRDKPMTARERVNREGAKMAKTAKSSGAKSKAGSGKAASKSKSKAGTKPKKSVKDTAKKPKAAKRSTRKK
ncbi:ribonuclease R [Shewanella oneidensis MR-1]|uniref:Ribonuclease R n=1 Tax=Shewanella oneidensis (strain ATCC 700550 / JCM 31522 / CIP 106686 / LMG 19005 / NCIMB 14063 / MR-1) TaxID=211586 RepID=Q8EAG7_SHEON|nr:ribonuclease R [Shewanella oneidensis]AAN56910.1 3'-5' exoribonuclease R Rnr [Shewanella oneidensis MR-1]MDX5998732.1 ribonuclease R [Shewanella oneidensis]MEE2027908.1 Ribonuclease R [Shewanella oneidensis]QKG98229.1 ribonuclease R [Shewanella oneidensis MR-1]